MLFAEMVYDSFAEGEMINVVKPAYTVISQSGLEKRIERKAIAARLAFIVAVDLDCGIIQASGAFHNIAFSIVIAKIKMTNFIIYPQNM